MLCRRLHHPPPTIPVTLLLRLLRMRRQPNHRSLPSLSTPRLLWTTLTLISTLDYHCTGHLFCRRSNSHRFNGPIDFDPHSRFVPSVRSFGGHLSGFVGLMCVPTQCPLPSWTYSVLRWD